MTDQIAQFFTYLDQGAIVMAIALVASLMTRAIKQTRLVWSKLPHSAKRWVPVVLSALGVLATLPDFDDWRVAVVVGLFETAGAALGAIGLHHFVNPTKHETQE